jgi:hypothetical protein
MFDMYFSKPLPSLTSVFTLYAPSISLSNPVQAMQGAVLTSVPKMSFRRPPFSSVKHTVERFIIILFSSCTDLQCNMLHINEFEPSNLSSRIVEIFEFLS